MYQAEKGILSGCRVLDMGRFIAAPYCAALLADFGADVIRIEPPEGAPDRTIMPIGSEVGGALYQQMNRGKRSLAIDIAHQEGRAIFDALVATADVVIVNLPPTHLARAGLDYQTLKSIKPDIILTTITAYSSVGTDKDLTGFDVTGQAISGAMHINGAADVPMRAAVSYVDYGTGTTAAFATLAALLRKMKTGEGQHVETSLLGTALNIMNPILIEAAAGTRYRQGTGNRSPISGPNDAYLTKDGWVMVQVIGDVMFGRWTEAVECPQLASDARFMSDIDRGENGEILSAVMAEWCAARFADDVIAELASKRIPCVRILSPTEALDARAVKEGEFFTPHGAPDTPIVHPVARVLGTTEFRHAPVLGRDNLEVLRELGLEAPTIRTGS